MLTSNEQEGPFLQRVRPAGKDVEAEMALKGTYAPLTSHQNRPPQRLTIAAQPRVHELTPPNSQRLTK